uniref:Granulins domain-containing protein n=1 Tax=Erpetoichthys calabaricus TaxID=27687 RepID=A0A8C4T306_ERPCA
MSQLVVLLLCLLAVSTARRCPDGGSCDDDATCCKSPSGQYACCPLPNAVCCEDHLHCCFEGTICDLKHSKCINKTISLPWLKKQPAVSEFPQEVNSFPMVGTGTANNAIQIVCPDKTSCPLEYSCAATNKGTYGCCPLPQGVSCGDGQHCCPNGYTCSKDGSSCMQHGESSVFGAIVCPDSEVECPDDATCCKLPDDSWGCCPMIEAVCCEDKLHCCPSGSKCDVAHSKCVMAEGKYTPMWSKFAARPRASWENEEDQDELKNTNREKVHLVEDVICPDGKSKCPSDTTCCLLLNGTYGCCPMPNAVCCLDHIHCCPAGTKCDLPHSTCVSANGETPLRKKIPALTRGNEDKVFNVPCDSVTACPDNTTCCRNQQGVWACCPLPKAVCCNDHVHCCPEGTTCDLTTAQCNSKAVSVPWLKKLPAKNIAVNEVKCDDTKSCPNGNTCCKKSTGAWGCCPLPNAVCCDDHEHCCPEGYTCDTTAGMCLSSNSNVQIKLPAPTLSETTKVHNVPCDDTVACPDNTTCCKTAKGSWACCPMPKAVCCSDHVHCCPEGTICDVTTLQCNPPELKMEKVSDDIAFSTAAGPCNCSQGMTCCIRKDEWSCCPLPGAVCCSDGKHCCPSGYVCDMTHNACKKRDIVVPWLEKLPAKIESPNNIASSLDIRCDDETSCAAGSTCCQLPTGKWGCCPLVKAVCCSDGQHCCPQGYHCNIQVGTCEKESNVATLVTQKVPTTQTPKQDVKCDARHYCPEGQTCCMSKTSNVTWECCPHAKGVCCDSEFCCPEGYICLNWFRSCMKFLDKKWDVLSGHKKKLSTRV